MRFRVGTSRTLAHTHAARHTRPPVQLRHALFACRSLAFAAAFACAFPANAAKIACVGDSITFGYGLGNPSSESYPAQLAQRLGSAHTVQNFGVSGATLLKNGDKPYWDETAYASSGTFDPDVVVVMLGTNDAKPQNWAKEAEFAPNYAELIQHYRALGALVYVATPPPVYPPGAFDIPPDVVENEVVPLVHTIATDAGAPLVDVFTALSGKASDFPDTVHPNATGAGLIADAVKAALDAHGFGGAGGTSGSGGASQGGRSNGGAPPLGGTAGTGVAGTGGAGGAPSTAGTSTSGGNGGAPSSGGATANGGVANGGSAGMNGATAGTAGATGAGGRPASGGAAGTSSGATGLAGTGTGATAGATTTGGAGLPNGGMPSTPSPQADESGCGCRVGDSNAPARPSAFGVLALGLALVARRRRAR